MLLFLFVLCVGAIPSLASAQSSFLNANAPGAVGESGSLFLVKEGFFARPFYNDFYGKTDKQLSGAFQFGYLSSWSDSSLESRVQWRMITPTFKEKYESQNLEEPVGRYADWIEWQEAWSKLYPVNGELFRFQIALGYGHIGNHGAKRLHRHFHELIGSPTEGLEYSNQPVGHAFSGGLEAGLISPERLLWDMKMESMLSVGYAQNNFMTDFFVTQNYVLGFSRDSEAALEMRLVRQAESSIFDDDDRLAWRSEIAFGWRYDWWRPSIKYVSPYLRGDQQGQTYLDLLAFAVRL